MYIFSLNCSQYGDVDAESQNFLPSQGKKKYEVEYVSALIRGTIRKTFPIEWSIL